MTDYIKIEILLIVSWMERFLSLSLPIHHRFRMLWRTRGVKTCQLRRISFPYSLIRSLFFCSSLSRSHSIAYLFACIHLHISFVSEHFVYAKHLLLSTHTENKPHLIARWIQTFHAENIASHSVRDYCHLEQLSWNRQ